MMYPSVFELVSSDPNVTALLGSGPTRFYLFGEADQGTVLPYAVWQRVAGTPENYLGTLPDADSYTLQIDVYAHTATEARNVARALRDALEPHAYVTSWRGETREPET